jgi:arabinan endo-1,5-alpha-L-arabinosidase
MKIKYSLFSAITAIVILLRIPAFALDGSFQSHDPSALIKDGSKYYMFTTGQGIYAAYSTNLFSWTSSPKTVFPVGTWPSWINSAVPGFNGDFWAPDCIFMNNKYYIYYSCSTFGSSTSAIGVATSPTLDPSSPSYNWTDLGMVVSSNSSNQVNAIDPGIFKDTDGRVYLTYGSFHAGIGVIELDPVTGKVKSGATLSIIAGGNGADWEAPYIVKNGSYYYLFVNRGFCCRGSSSTYYIVMGRSTNIKGPYLDMNGVNLRNGGGTTMISSSGKYIGPGHFGLLRENGSNFVSMHYYDGNDNGKAKLDIANLGFNNNWPFITRDWIAQGRYKITNKNSNLVWDSWGCTGALNEPIAQGAWANLLCQQWDLTPLGNGIYRFASAQTGRVADVINCNPNNDTKLQLYTWLNNNCQKYKIERLADGSHIFTSLTGNRVVEVPGASLTAGTQLGIWDYNNNNCQKWLIAPPGSAALTQISPSLDIDEAPGTAGAYTVYPNPISGGAFQVIFQQLPKNNVHLEIFTDEGKLVYRNRYSAQQTLSVITPLSAGVYLLKINTGASFTVKKLIFK